MKTYLGTAIKMLAKYLAEATVSFPEFLQSGFTEAHFAAFSLWLCEAEMKSSQVIKTTISGVYYFCVTYHIPVQLAVQEHLSRPPNQSRICSWGAQVHEGARRSATAAKKKKKALPLTAPMIIPLTDDCVRRGQASDSDGPKQERALHSVNFLGANRPAETMTKLVDGKLVCPVLRWKNVKFQSHGKMSIFYPHAKAKKNVTVHYVATGKSLCAVDAMKQLLAVRKKAGKAYTTDPVFLCSNGVDPLSYAEGVTLLKNAVRRVLGHVLGRGVSGCSYRRGAATTGFNMGLSIDATKTITRHSSNSVFNYIAAGGAASQNWQRAVAGLNPKLAWFGHMAKDRALRLHVSNLDNWDSIATRPALKWGRSVR